MQQRLRWWLPGLVLVGWVLWRGLHLYTEWLWFNAVGYEGVFVRSLATRVGFLALGTVLALTILLGNFLLSRRLDDVPAWALPRPGEVSGGPVMWAVLPLLLAVVSVVFGNTVAALWQPFLLWRHGAASGVVDPVLGQDVAFYLTSVPFLLSAQRLLFGLAATSWLLLYLRYIELPVPGESDSFGDLTAVVPAGRAHLSALGALVFGLGAWGCLLGRYQLVLTSRSSVVHGVSCADAAVRLPLLSVLAGVCLLAAVSLLVNVRRRSLRHLAWTVGLSAAVAGVGLVAPIVYQRLAVLPNEIERERPFIERTIAATRFALGLDRAVDRQYQPGQSLTAAKMAAERETTSTVPLWSAPEITEQFVGTEALRSYYNFLSADYDRYTVGGVRQQVAIVAREMQVDRLQASAQNWVNRHLIYTHGFGVVMASAHETSAVGAPVKIIRDVPPRTPPDLPLTQPRIYYGEIPSDYIITGLRPEAATGELDYPAGEINVPTTYAGRGGFPLGGLFRRAALAARFKSLNILISRMPAADSRFHFRRSLMERLEAIAPFLAYDSEPYPVVADGRITWLVDAYTISARYPYGRPYSLTPAAALAQERHDQDTRQHVAYIRNSVKVTVDAYDGTVRFHLFDASDPLILAWERCFPGLFTRDPLPPALAGHIRYPADLFALQARAYSRFHMQQPEVFYNGEDLWDIAREETTTREPQADGSYRFVSERERITPYYVLLRLPGEPAAKFRLIVPFTPASAAEAQTGRDNMIGWMAADCDPDTYGRLTVFQFPKNTLVYGPMQVEALIDQDPDISQQMTLWSERGSQVLRGKLLVIPVGDTLLYVEPIYLTAERRGALPELKRVVVFYKGRVRMAETLDAAVLLALSGAREDGGAIENLRLQRLADQAGNVFAEAEDARRRGDLQTYGEKLRDLSRTLQEMGGRRRDGAVAPTP